MRKNWLISCLGVVLVAILLTASYLQAEVSSSDRQDGAFQRKTLKLTAEEVVIVEGGTGTNGYGGAKIYDFPEGRILVHGVVADLKITFAPSITNEGVGIDVGLGTAAVTDGDITDSTDIDLCAAIAVDPFTNATVAVQGQLAAAAQFDGTATAKDMYVNINIDDADISATATGRVTGTIVITYSELGDY